VCTLPVPDIYNEQIVQHADSIVSMVPQVDKKWGTRNGPVAVILPLKTVAMFSPDEGQRDYARGKLDRWDRGIGMGGVFEVPVVAVGNLYENIYSA
jgi:hypothetical protein